MFLSKSRIQYTNCIDVLWAEEKEYDPRTHYFEFLMMLIVSLSETGRERERGREGKGRWFGGDDLKYSHMPPRIAAVWLDYRLCTQKCVSVFLVVGSAKSDCLSVYSAIHLFVHMEPLNNNNEMQVDKEIPCPATDFIRKLFNRFFSRLLNMAVNLSRLISITLHQVTTLLRPNRNNHSIVWWGFFFVRVQISYWYLVSSTQPSLDDINWRTFEQQPTGFC